MIGPDVSSNVTFDDAANLPSTGLRLFKRERSAADRLSCWISLPDQVDPAAPALVAVHGIHRDARTQAMLFGQQAREQGRVVIAPLFSYRHWRGYQQVYGKRRADQGLLTLLDELRVILPADLSRFDLFGYSGGAQFAHRFALAYPHRVRELHLLAAGWYSFPDDAPYPYGLGLPASPVPGFSPLLKASLGHFLSLPIRVYVGEQDNVVDEHVRTGEAIDRQQGPNRLERGRRWVAALGEAAQLRDIEPDIRFQALPDSGHDFKTCVERGGLLDAMVRSHEHPPVCK